MKKIFLIIILVLSLTSCIKNKELNSKDDFYITINKQKKCSNSSIKKYFTQEDRSLYLVCINDIEVKSGKSSYLFKRIFRKRSRKFILFS